MPFTKRWKKAKKKNLIASTQYCFSGRTFKNFHQIGEFLADLFISKKNLKYLNLFVREVPKT